jgi:hypothetical protein
MDPQSAPGQPLRGDLSTPSPVCQVGAELERIGERHSALEAPLKLPVAAPPLDDHNGVVTVSMLRA